MWLFQYLHSFNKQIFSQVNVGCVKYNLDCDKFLNEWTWMEMNCVHFKSFFHILQKRIFWQWTESDNMWCNKELEFLSFIIGFTIITQVYSRVETVAFQYLRTALISALKFHEILIKWSQLSSFSSFVCFIYMKKLATLACTFEPGSQGCGFKS